MPVDASHLPLERAYRWEKEQGSSVYMTQPMGGSEIKTFTWKQTLDQARRMAAYLKAQGFEPGSNIAVLSKNCAEFMMTDLAIWMAGYVSVALYPTLNADTVRYILEHSESKLLFVGKLDTWDEMKPGVPEGLPCVSYPLSPPNATPGGDGPTWSDIVAETEPIEGSPTRAEDEVAILIYTSGSTGQPKGVALTFGNMGTAAKGFEDIFGVNPGDRQISYLPLAHSFERAVVEMGSLHNGNQVFFAESLDTFVQDLQRAKPTVFHSVPRLWLKFNQGVSAKMPEKKLKLMLKIPILSGIVKRKILTKLGLDEARIAFSGSAPIPPELIQWYRDLGLELLEGYAMSENFAYSHVSLPGKSRVGYVGHALPGVECKLSDEGEILIKSEANMIGYFKHDDATAEAFTDDGFLKTGDRGEIDSDGRLKITGRVKELFKTSKGKYIAPAPIENLLNAHGNIEQSCVSGSGQPAPHAVVMLPEDLLKNIGDSTVKQQVSQALGELLAEVNGKVEHHERLAFLAVAKDTWSIENGFLTPTMKIKRSALEDAYGPNVESWYGRGDKIIWEADAK